MDCTTLSLMAISENLDRILLEDKPCVLETIYMYGYAICTFKVTCNGMRCTMFDSNVKISRTAFYSLITAVRYCYDNDIDIEMFKNEVLNEIPEEKRKRMREYSLANFIDIARFVSFNRYDDSKVSVERYLNNIKIYNRRVE